MDILNKGTKYLMILLVVVFQSCAREDELAPIVQVSKMTIGFQEYDRIWNQGNDSLALWSKSKLPAYRSFWSYRGKLDSIICFNKEGDKMIGALLVQCDKENCLQDDLHYFYGVRIKQNWFFFKGANVTLPREMYQGSTRTPLSFSRLHNIALDEIFKGYLVRTKGNKWTINEKWFQYHFGNDAYNNPYTTQEAWEASYIKLINENWKRKID